jgi:serine/threonine protein kinase
VSSYSPRPSAYGVDSSVPPAERYRIVGRIAAGGMAEIYLARMTGPNGVEREIVLKRLMPELQNDHEFVQMFYDEAQIASQLNHPNIVQIFELGEIDDSLFIAMELLRGVNLRDLLARLHAENKRMPLELCVRTACGALEALDYAHAFSDHTGTRLNVVHRDVSPQNIILTYEGMVKLVDFGVAKAEGKLHQTRAGLVKGKFAYMSPEQIGGAQLDGRSDVFALAEVVYELLLHRHPFFAENDMDVLRMILDADPPHPLSIDPSFPPALAEILMKALRKRPDDRYADAAAMQEALERFLVEAGMPAPNLKLGRFVRQLFDDRMAAEQRARETGNDDLLIEAMTVGRTERVNMDAMSGPPPASYEPDVATDAYDEPEHATLTSVPNNGAGHGQPQGGGAYHSEIGRLFDGQGQPIGGRHEEGVEDAAEMPTMLGTLSAEQLAEVRNAAAGLRSSPQVQAPQFSGPPPTQRSNPQVQVGPAQGRPSQGVITRSGGPTADPAEMRGGGGVSVGPAPVVQPPPPQPPPPQPTSVPPTVTPRSATVVGDEGKGGKRKADKFGIWFFIAGLGALVGAVIYAIVLLSEPSNPTMSLVIQSTPQGASIVLDGFDTGAKTPQTIPSIRSDKPHTIELRLDGYEKFERRIEPAPELEGEPYVIHWRFQPAGGGGGTP